ncbi:MAG: glycogen debranching protein [Oscillatoriales cyanobacterium]|nr:MAG: glycogen debranching protein [Oscillatoriales cyanobacterium]
MTIRFGEAIVGDLAQAERREWLVTNGIGGYACGTVAGILTRHYHGLMIAALAPPHDRRLLLTKLDELVYYNGGQYPLFANRWATGLVAPSGYRYIQHFELEGRIPTWTFACGDALLEKRIWMEQGENTTYVQYRLRRSQLPISMFAKVLVNDRSHHGGSVRHEWHCEPVHRGACIWSGSTGTPLYVTSDRGRMNVCYDWHFGFQLQRECERGTGAMEDHLHLATIEATMAQGETLTIVASTQPASAAHPAQISRQDGETALERSRQHDRVQLDRWRLTRLTPPVPDLENPTQTQTQPQTQAQSQTQPQPQTQTNPDWIQQLILAADSFIVERPQPDGSLGHSIIAGYPWFRDWGRDAAIALPGLTLTTGRYTLARSILKSMARFFRQGLLPNIFPDANSEASYNTIDATLWYVEAVRAYVEHTDDRVTLAELFPHLQEAIAWYEHGTCFDIGMDKTDGLIRGGSPETQLTWMDVKIDGKAVTPRSGKAVEINALWYNTLRSMAAFCVQLQPSAPTLPTPVPLPDDIDHYARLANQVERSFQVFWNPSMGCCYDTIDGPHGDDAALRPNQIFAVSLHYSPLTAARQRAIVDQCSAKLLTSGGLRSLSPDHPHYRGRYRGDVQVRDRAYHQGTVWAWLIGAFAIAHLRVYDDWQTAQDFLTPFADRLQEAGIGSLSEIFDGDPVHRPRGCIAQAWSVAEVLRAWHIIDARRQQKHPTDRPPLPTPPLCVPPLPS